jgi:hypothetical protein
MYNMNVSIGSYKFRGEILILIVIVGLILFGHTLCGCSKVTAKEGFYMAKNVMQSLKEGFSPANTNNGDSARYTLGDYTPVNTSSWFQANLALAPGQKPSKGAQKIWDRKKQPIPLPEGELDMFATTPFKGSCCPNTYSTSTGCACMTVDQYKYLNGRGGNNVPYSEY